MGDRAILHIHDGESMGPAVYLHWCGGAEGIEKLLAALRDRMGGRFGDVSYATARLIGLAHVEIEGCLSLGVWSVPDSAFIKARKDMLRQDAPTHLDGRKRYPYSHGDFGVALVSCRDWSVECFGGYGLRGALGGYCGPPTRFAFDENTWTVIDPVPAEGPVTLHARGEV